MAVTLKKQAFYIRDGQEYTDPGIFITDVPAAVEAVGEQQKALVTAEGTTQVGNVQTKRAG